MLFQFCLLFTVSLLEACEYNGTKHVNGEKWKCCSCEYVEFVQMEPDKHDISPVSGPTKSETVFENGDIPISSTPCAKDNSAMTVKSAFVLQCNIYADGSWKAEIIGCQTNLGRFMHEGENYTENEIRYNCVRLPDGSMRIQRNYGLKNAASCEGHAIGESWVVRTNFNKTCTNNGTRISNCFTDSGIPIALNSKLVSGSITYSCEQHPNGTVILTRQSEPTVGKTVQQKIVCKVNGESKIPGDKWVENGRFVKKCDERGAILIEKCVLDDSLEMDLNSQITRDGKTYTCKEHANGTVSFRMEQRS